jgi:hypothetical protein
MGSAIHTVMSWWLDDVDGKPDVCRHLIVLNHGQAYANTVSCARGQILTHVEGWLTTPEMEIFDRWPTAWARIYTEDNSFNGQGMSEVTTAQIDEMAQWVEELYTRLAE